MSNRLIVFLKLLATNLDTLSTPGTDSESSRRIAALAGRQLRRLIIDETERPRLRILALQSYKECLPALKDLVHPELCSRFGAAIAVTSTADWTLLEDVLLDVLDTLLAKDGPTHRRIASRLLSVDADLRANKELVWINSTIANTADNIADAAENNDDELCARLQAFIRSRFVNETRLQVTGIKRVPGGFSKETMFVYLDQTALLPNAMVMRRDAPYETGGSSVTMEYPVIEQLYESGVAMPVPFAIEETGAILGKPFMLVSRVPGRNIGDFIVVAEPSRELALDLAAKMAKLHAASFDGLESILRGGKTSVRERVLSEIVQHEAMWSAVVHQKTHLIHAALAWLKRNIGLAEGPRAVVHNDIGVHNILVHENSVAAFLDWESAVIGTPAEDVAYTYYTVTQMLDWSEFLQAYEKASDRTLDRRQLDFYMLWASVRVAVGISRMVDPVFGGDRNNLTEFFLGDYFGQVLMLRISEKLAEVLIS